MIQSSFWRFNRYFWWIGSVFILKRIHHGITLSFFLGENCIFRPGICDKFKAINFNFIPEEKFFYAIIKKADNNWWIFSWKSIKNFINFLKVKVIRELRKHRPGNLLGYISLLPKLLDTIFLSRLFEKILQPFNVFEEPLVPLIKTF